MDAMDELKQGIAKKLNGIINPKEENKKPHNRLWIALIAFNLIFFPLDIATGVTVGIATRWYYGLFVFGAGFGTMIVHEALYSNPYAGRWQKVISIIGFLTSTGITLLIGVTAIVVNVLMSGYNRELYGVGMAGTAFVVLFFHGFLIATYYFTDHGIQTKQKATAAAAKHEQVLSDFAFAERLTDKVNSLEQRLLARVERGDGARMGAALNNLTGEDWIENAEKAANHPTKGQLP